MRGGFFIVLAILFVFLSFFIDPSFMMHPISSSQDCEVKNLHLLFGSIF